MRKTRTVEEVCVASDIRDYIEYKHGYLIWKVNVNKRYAKAGDKAGTLRKDGYRTVTLHGKKYLYHRLVFFLCNGYMPEFVDHINRDKDDNSIENLRAVTSYESARNRCTFKEGGEGINPVGNNKFQLIYRGVYIGRFASEDEARDYRDSLLCGI